MQTLVFLFVALVLLILFNIYKKSFVYPNNPVLKPRAWKIVIREEKDCNGNTETRYYPMERILWWEQLWYEESEDVAAFIGSETCLVMSTSSLQSAANILRMRYQTFDLDGNIDIEVEDDRWKE